MAAYLLWPALIAMFVAITLLASSAGPVGLGLTAAAITVILLLAERARPRSLEEDASGDPELVHDLGHALLANGIALATDALALGIGALAAGDLFGLHVWPTAWPLVLQGALAVVLANGLEYGRHRLLHRVAWPTRALLRAPFGRTAASSRVRLETTTSSDPAIAWRTTSLSGSSSRTFRRQLVSR